jgi:flavodoxin
MKVLVTYFSQTGNTEKLARAIYDAIPFEKELLRIKDVKSSQGYTSFSSASPFRSTAYPLRSTPF